MKKRILALALAGTTAFSMFGGLNVFAMSSDSDKFETYTAVSMNYQYDATTGKGALGDHKTPYTSTSMINTVMTFDEAMEENVEAGTVYLYDFYDSHIATDRYTVANVKTALGEEDSLSAMAKILANGLTTASADYNFEDIVYENGIGKAGSIRRAVYVAFSDFVDETSTSYGDYSYKYDLTNDGKDNPTDIYNFEKLLDAIKGANADSMKTSEMVYLMQQYDIYVNGGYVDVVTSDTTAYRDLLVDILEARTEADVKAASKKTFRYWTAELEDLLAANDAATTPSKIASVTTKLETEVKSANAGTAVKADLTDLKAALASADYYVAAKDDYKVATNDWTDEYDWFETVLNLYTKTGVAAYQSSIDVYTEALTAAMDDLTPTVEAKASALLALEEVIDDNADRVEGDYKAAAWTKYETALNLAEELLEGTAGKKMTAIVTDELSTAAANLDKNIVSVKLSQLKALKAAINEGNAWLKSYDDTASSAQVLAVTKAVAAAEKVYDTNPKLISKVEGAIADIDAALNYADITLGWSKNAAGEDVYGTPDGYLANGWNKIGNAWYYFNADGTAKRNTWFKDTDGKWYWFTNNCNAAYGWCKVKDNWFFFDGGCAMKTGWVKSAGSWYYLNPEKEDGRMLTGWQEIDGKWYYFSKETNALGQMLYNTTVDGYKLGADGAWVK